MEEQQRVAKIWSNVYFFLEFVWMAFWAGTIVAYLAGLGSNGEFYRIYAHLHAFHLVLLPSVAYVLRDGERHIILGFLGVIVTDSAMLWDFIAHTPDASKAVDWAFITSVVRAGFALFITLFATLWFVYVWYHNVKFRTQKKGDAESMIKFRLK
jgi:hypothetical protein